MNVTELETRKRASMGQVLIRSARLFNECALRRVRARTGRDVRVAHTSIFPHLDFEGTRLTTLAARVGVSKQAVGQLVDELEAWGWLERIPDPSDGRAKLVRFATSEDESMLSKGLGMLVAVEDEIVDQLGARRADRLHRDLLALLDTLERS